MTAEAHLTPGPHLLKVRPPAVASSLPISPGFHKESGKRMGEQASTGNMGHVLPSASPFSSPNALRTRQRRCRGWGLCPPCRQ